MRSNESAATLTIPDAARMIGISRNSCYEAARRGELPILKIGNRILVIRSQLEKMLGIPRVGAAEEKISA